MKKPATLGLAISAKNEAHLIEKCIRSVPMAQHVLVVDTLSTDHTAAVARSLGAQVITRPDPGIRNQKQFALEQMTTDWVLVLDPDEWLTSDLQNEITELLKSETAQAGFEIPRFHLFLGKILKHGRGIDYPVRLVRKGQAVYSPHEPHEYIMVKGQVSRLLNGMVHESTPTITKRIAKIEKETELELRFAPQELPTAKELFLDPLIYFFYCAFRYSAWKDGVPGLILAALFSFQLFIMRVKFYELRTRS